MVDFASQQNKTKQNTADSVVRSGKDSDGIRAVFCFVLFWGKTSPDDPTTPGGGPILVSLGCQMGRRPTWARMGPESGRFREPTKQNKTKCGDSSCGRVYYQT